MVNEQYIRNCPNCDKKIFYTQKNNFNRAKNKNSICKSCCQEGKIISDDCKKKMSIIKIGKQQSLITKLKNSNTNKQRYLDNPSLKKRASEISKRTLHLPNIRKNHIEAMSKIHFLGNTCDKGQLELIKKWNQLGFNFQINHQLHTDNFLCYIDGYDEDKNVVLEYDGKYHNNIKQKQKDLVRQQKIIDILKPKKFWRYDSVNKQWKNILGGDTR